MLRIFEAIKKSPFLNGNYPFCPLPKNASAEFGAHAQQTTCFRTKISKTGVTPAPVTGAKMLLPRSELTHALISMSPLSILNSEF